METKDLLGQSLVAGTPLQVLPGCLFLFIIEKIPRARREREHFSNKVLVMSGSP
jgi:hypothetical protein